LPRRTESFEDAPDARVHRPDQLSIGSDTIALRRPARLPRWFDRLVGGEVPEIDQPGPLGGSGLDQPDRLFGQDLREMAFIGLRASLVSNETRIVVTGTIWRQRTRMQEAEERVEALGVRSYRGRLAPDVPFAHVMSHVATIMEKLRQGRDFAR